MSYELRATSYEKEPEAVPGDSQRRGRFSGLQRFMAHKPIARGSQLAARSSIFPTPCDISIVFLWLPPLRQRSEPRLLR